MQNSEIIEKLKKLKPERTMEQNDLGNGWLFATVFKDLCRYNATVKEWFFYKNGVWKQDTGGMITSGLAKTLADALVLYCLGLEDERTKSPFLKHCAKLGQLRYRETMIKDARDYHFFYSEDLDKDLFILNCQNGVLDLKTFEFKPHSPEYLCSKIANVSYNPDVADTEWTKFINSALENDAEKIEYLQKLLGYSLTGGTQEESCYLLYGSSTRNGKSTCVETYAFMLGGAEGYALNMKPETLAMKQNNDSRNASSDIARLRGCRFLNASEPPKRMVFDVALLKTLLGRDSITARFLHQNEFQFIPVFKLFINTNFLPTITDQTLFSSGRVNVITFDKHFSPEEQDKGLKDRLKQPENLSGLLNWCLEGLKKYYEYGALPPQKVQEATDQYQSDSDKIGCFIQECLLKTPGKNSKAKDVYTEYGKWCDDNGFGTENKNNFFAELKSKGIFAKTGTVGGRTFRNVVKDYMIAADEKFMPTDEPSPFD